MTDFESLLTCFSAFRPVFRPEKLIFAILVMGGSQTAVFDRIYRIFRIWGKGRRGASIFNKKYSMFK